MTRRRGLSLSIIIWRIGGGWPNFLFPWGPKILLEALKTDIDDLTELLLKVALNNNKTDIDDLTELLLKVA
jgi:CO dehydrogenase/acetyl-CoA synthase beta subunit